MSRETKFSLMYWDMWQLIGRYQPRADRLVRVAPSIIRMGVLRPLGNILSRIVAVKAFQGKKVRINETATYING